MERKKNLQIFISFCGADEDKKVALENALQPMIAEYVEQGVEINVADMAKMDASYWDKWMIQTLKASDLVIAILSNATMYPENGVPKRVLEELCEARNNGIEILPVIFDRPVSDEFRAHINRISQIWRTYDGAEDDVYQEAARKAGFLIKGILEGKKSQTYESVKLLGGRFLSNPHFVGRERELRVLQEKFQETNVVILTGEGGIGKTSLAQQFFYDYKHLYDRAYIINASNGVRQAITDMVFENSESISDEVERYQENCKKLSLLDEKVIIIFIKFVIFLNKFIN
jgi:hypothetical protein